VLELFLLGSIEVSSAASSGSGYPNMHWNQSELNEMAAPKGISKPVWEEIIEGKFFWMDPMQR
jgi:hypothetical protein